jgi:predicted nucleic acid-binding protein
MSAALAGRKFFDTNVLVYLHDRDDPRKRAVASEILEAAVRSDEVVLSTQVLQEFFVVTTGPAKAVLDVEAAEAQVRRYSRLEVVGSDAALVLLAIQRQRSSRVSFWDALIVEAALRAGCRTLYSEDLQDGWVVDGQLTVVNPFAATS